MWTPDICIYHFPCDDGFASAWIAKRKWPDVVLAPTNYGQPFPDVNYAGQNILIADFSYHPVLIANLITTYGARSIVMLDHHKTAAADLKDFNVEMCGSAQFCAADLDGMFRDMAELDRPPVLARFDMERSGASLTWEFCFPDKPQPPFVAMIEDRDLWRFAIADSRAFSLYLRSFPRDLAVWDIIAARMERDPHLVMVEAVSIARFYDHQIAEVVATATLKNIGRWKDVPVAYAPYAFASDIANELLKAHPSAPFAAVVVDAYGGRTYSLRSDDSREDVSEVAKTFGGGGHRNAAGFRVPA